MSSVDTATNNVEFSVGSIPADYGYDESFSKEDELSELQAKPRILLLGLKRYVHVHTLVIYLNLNFIYRSGKSSIKNVVFHKMQAAETLFLETTTKTNAEGINCFWFYLKKI